MLLINFNKKQNKRLWQLCNCGFAPKNTFPFSQSTTARHLCDFLQQKQLQKLVIKALNLEQVFQIPTEKDIIFSHKNYATRTFKAWIVVPVVLGVLSALSVGIKLVSSTARVTSMESTKHGVTQSLTSRSQLGLLLIVTVEFSTFVNWLYVSYFWHWIICLLLLSSDGVFYFWWRIILRIASISSYIKCTAVHGSMIDQHSQTFPYDWLTLQLWGSLLDNSSSKYWWKMRLTTGVVCCSYLFWCVQSNNTCIGVSAGHFQKIGRGQEKIVWFLSHLHKLTFKSKSCLQICGRMDSMC